MLVMASLKAVLPGNTFLGQPAVLPSCRTYAFTPLSFNSAGFSCIDNLHWEVSLDLYCMCALASIAVYLRTKSNDYCPQRLYNTGTHVTLTRPDVLTLSELAH